MKFLNLPLMILKDSPYARHTLRLSCLLMVNNLSEGFAFVIVVASGDAVGACLCFILLTPCHHVNNSVSTEAIVFKTRSTGFLFWFKKLTFSRVAASAFFLMAV